MTSRRAVALVGGSGLVGLALAQRLHDGGERVLVVDRVRPRIAVDHVVVDLLDANSAALTAIFRRFAVDRVVHLVARVDPPKDAADREAMRRLHLDGTRAVVEAATAVDVDHVVLVSSAVVYGAYADNPLPLSIDAPLRPNPFPYAEDKAAQEALVRSLVVDDMLTVVRPAIVYAAHAHNYLTEIIRRARLPLVRGVLPALDGHRPPLQFVHVDDVAAIIAAALAKRVTGTLHAASSDWLAWNDVADIAGLRVVDVPLRLIGPVLDRLVPLLPPSLRAPSALFPYLMFPFVIDMASTTKALQLAPAWSSADTLRAMLAGR